LVILKRANVSLEKSSLKISGKARKMLKSIISQPDHTTFEMNVIYFINCHEGF